MKPDISGAEIPPGSSLYRSSGCCRDSLGLLGTSSRGLGVLGWVNLNDLATEAHRASDYETASHIYKEGAGSPYGPVTALQLRV